MTPLPHNRRSFWSTVLGIAFCCSCHAADTSTTADAPAAYFRAQADSGAAAWNRGDLDSFLAPYADSVVLVYPDGPRHGRDSLAAIQRRNVAWGGVRPAEQARIGASEVRHLTQDAALQTVEIILQHPANGVRHLWATVVWRRTSAGWRVIHEQSF